MEALPASNTHIFSYNKNDVEAEILNVVIGQFSVATQDAHVLFDYGTTHFFASHTFARKLIQFRDRIGQNFRMTTTTKVGLDD